MYIFSDCQTVITAICSNNLTESHQQDINVINEIIHNFFNSSKTTMTMSWVGGHASIKANDFADLVAKREVLKIIIPKRIQN